MNHGHHFLSSGHSKCSAVTEIVLHVDHQKNIGILGSDAHT